MASTRVHTRSIHSRTASARLPVQPLKKPSRPALPPIHVPSITLSEFSSPSFRDNSGPPPFGRTSKKGKLQLALDSLNQSNSFDDEDDTVTLRSLPPVKVSLLSSHKLMESPRSDTGATSSLLRPTYCLRTYREGHHVFTEGLSDISRTKNPSFALKKIPVPYSNLPDNIQIFKEKSKFSFGVRDEINSGHTSPYKLSSKRYGLGDKVHFAPPIDVGKTVRDKARNKKMSHFFGPKKTPKNKIILDPIRKPGELETEKNSDNSSPKPAKSQNPAEAKATVKTISIPETPGKSHRTPIEKSLERGESRISVVSIGDTVSPDHYDKPKKHARKLYPLYDWRSQQRDLYTRSKFNQIGTRSVHTASSTKSMPTKVSTNLIKLDVETTKGKGTPRRKKSDFMFQRVPSNLQYIIDDDEVVEHDAEFNGITNQRLINKYGYGRKQQQGRPKSIQSNTSTDVSPFPINPPPSEISQYVLDDFAHYSTADFKQEMRTLHEEREKTLPVIDIQAVTNANVDDDSPINMDELPETNTIEQLPLAEDQQTVDSVPSLPPIQRDTSQDRYSVTQEVILETSESEPEVFVPESFREELEYEIPPREQTETSNGRENDTKTKDAIPIKEVRPNLPQIKVNEATKPVPKGVKGLKTASVPPKLLPIPTVNLEPQSHNPLTMIGKQPNAGINGHTSLSRSIQNTVVPAPSNGKKALSKEPEKEPEEEVAKDTIQLPITRVKLYSETSDTASVQTPAVSLTDEFGEQQQLFYANHSNSKLQGEKGDQKVVNNTNISFTSPLVVEKYAKRQ